MPFSRFLLFPKKIKDWGSLLYFGSKGNLFVHSGTSFQNEKKKKKKKKNYVFLSNSAFTSEQSRSFLRRLDRAGLTPVKATVGFSNS